MHRLYQRFRNAPADDSSQILQMFSSNCFFSNDTGIVSLKSPRLNKMVLICRDKLSFVIS